MATIAVLSRAGLSSHLIRGITTTNHGSIFDDVQQKNIEAALVDVKDIDEIKYILSLRFKSDQKGKYIYKNTVNNSASLKQITESNFQYLLAKFIHAPKDENILEEIKSLYLLVAKFDDESRAYRTNLHYEDTKIPIQIAKKIMAQYKDYPKILGSLAEKACRLHANERLIPVGKIAADKEWFE